MFGFFKGNCLGLQKFLPPTQSTLFFCSQKLWRLIFLALEPWAGVPCVGLGLLALKISLPNFYPPLVDMGTRSFQVSAPPTSLDGCGFFNFLVVRLPISSTSDASGWLVVLYCSCNFDVVVRGGKPCLSMPNYMTLVIPLT